MDDLTTLKAHVARRAELLDQLATVEQERDDEIRHLIASGRHKAATIAEAAGVSVPRVYQIRDGRR